MSTLAVVQEILRETGFPMSVRQIVEHAAGRLPTRSKTPDTVVARDLSMDIKKKGEESLFIRTSPGRYTLRELHLAKLAETADTSQDTTGQDTTGQNTTGQGSAAHVAPPATEADPAARPVSQPLHASPRPMTSSVTASSVAASSVAASSVAASTSASAMTMTTPTAASLHGPTGSVPGSPVTSSPVLRAADHEGHERRETTRLLSSAMRSERVGTLPAKIGPGPTDHGKHTGTE